MDVVERKLKNKQVDRYERNNQSQQMSDYRRGQKTYQRCGLCYFNQQKNKGLFEQLVGETEFWSVLFPMKVKPLFAEGREPVLHLQLAPKSHFDNCVTLDEEVYRDLKGLKMALMEYFNKHGATQTVFIETAFAEESMGGSHALIDAVGVPDIDHSDD